MSKKNQTTSTIHVLFRPAHKENYIPPQPPQPRYLTFTAQEDNSHVGFYCNKDLEDPENPLTTSLEYSTDGGTTWNPYDLVHSYDPVDTSLIELKGIGDTVMFRGNNPYFSQAGAANDEGAYIQCVCDGLVAASGDLTSLLNGVGGDVTLTRSTFYRIFQDCTSLTSAPALPSTSLADNCYRTMFSNCTSLTSAPALPATTLAVSCYSYMFDNCTSLTSAPALPATSLADNCYSYMFSNCTSLTSAPTLPATTLAVSCYSNMFYGCSSLTSAPTLPATSLAADCYNSMFSNCTSLTSAPALPATTLASYCYSNMFNGCTSLTVGPYIEAKTLAKGCFNSMYSGCTKLENTHFATMNNSTNVFQNNIAAIKFAIDDDVPPTIAANTISGLASSCAFYVPVGCADAYSAAQYWSARSGRFYETTQS